MNSKILKVEFEFLQKVKPLKKAKHFRPGVRHKLY